MNEIESLEPESAWLRIEIVRDGKRNRVELLTAGGGCTYDKKSLIGVTEFSIKRLGPNPMNAADVSLRNANRRLQQDIVDLKTQLGRSSSPPTVGFALKSLWRALRLKCE